MSNPKQISTLGAADLSERKSIPHALSIAAAIDVIARLRSGQNQEALEAAERMLVAMAAAQWASAQPLDGSTADGSLDANSTPVRRRRPLGYLEGKGSLSLEEALAPLTDEELRSMGLAD